jgi:hypothetical protein
MAHADGELVEPVVFLEPHSLAAAICSAMACPEILTVGTAMRSVLVKSAMVFTAGLRVVST